MNNKVCINSENFEKLLNLALQNCQSNRVKKDIDKNILIRKPHISNLLMNNFITTQNVFQNIQDNLVKYVKQIVTKGTGILIIPVPGVSININTISDKSGNGYQKIDFDWSKSGVPGYSGSVVGIYAYPKNTWLGIGNYPINLYMEILSGVPPALSYNAHVFSNSPPIIPLVPTSDDGYTRGNILYSRDGNVNYESGGGIPTVSDATPGIIILGS
jgi:hypothetical protein